MHSAFLPFFFFYSSRIHFVCHFLFSFLFFFFIILNIHYLETAGAWKPISMLISKSLQRLGSGVQATPELTVGKQSQEGLGTAGRGLGVALGVPTHGTSSSIPQGCTCNKRPLLFLALQGSACKAANPWGCFKLLGGLGRVMSNPRTQEIPK